MPGYPTTAHDYTFDLFRNSLSVNGVRMSIAQAKRMYPEDSAYIDWFIRTYA